jgi:hypothetical protein
VGDWGVAVALALGLFALEEVLKAVRRRGAPMHRA